MFCSFWAQFNQITETKVLWRYQPSLILKWPDSGSSSVEAIDSSHCLDQRPRSVKNSSRCHWRSRLWFFASNNLLLFIFSTLSLRGFQTSLSLISKLLCRCLCQKFKCSVFFSLFVSLLIDSFVFFVSVRLLFPFLRCRPNYSCRNGTHPSSSAAVCKGPLSLRYFWTF